MNLGARRQLGEIVPVPLPGYVTDLSVLLSVYRTLRIILSLNVYNAMLRRISCAAVGLVWF